MEKTVEIGYLLGFYAPLLTDKQRSLSEMYYGEDLSLGEIAQAEGISRQGVRDALLRAQKQLYELEGKLALAHRHREMTARLAHARACLNAKPADKNGALRELDAIGALWEDD